VTQGLRPVCVCTFLRTQAAVVSMTQHIAVRVEARLLLLLLHCALLVSGSASAAVTGAVRLPLYVFSDHGPRREEALQRFQRIDDVIMGGVSKSKLVAGDGCASWRGLVRTEGGGFCGQRTCPFEYPLNASGTDGVYIECRLASDAQPERRVWKLSLRTQEGRGEVVYQAPFVPPAGRTVEPVFVPFSDFVLVRGPIAVPGAPKLSKVGALYQLGFTVSKFVIGETMTPLEDFRNGTFQLDIGELGLYTDGAPPAVSEAEADLLGVEAPPVVSEAEAMRARPLVERLLAPVFRALFSEKRRRRRRAADLLVRRGTSRVGLARIGWQLKRRARGKGLVVSVMEATGEGMSAAVSGALLLLCKALFFPLLRLAARRQRRMEVERAKAERAEA